jgi:hypothetical protein
MENNQWKTVKVTNLFVGNKSKAQYSCFEDGERKVEYIPDGNCIVIKEYIKAKDQPAKTIKCHQCLCVWPAGHNFCPECGKPLDEPPEPIIKRSGETWVARFDGVDYLWVGKYSETRPDFFHPGETISSLWRDILELELTDEIAKLRPMVVYDNNGNHKLTYVCPDGKMSIICGKDCPTYTKMLSLATIDDLP